MDTVGKTPGVRPSTGIIYSTPFSGGAHRHAQAQRTQARAGIEAATAARTHQRIAQGAAALRHADARYRPAAAGRISAAPIALLRKAAGYTQQQLADEIGASWRQVAYYEGESDHPPASLLIALAQALNVTTDELLGIGAKRKAATPAISTRLERRLRLIERMPAKPKQQLLGLIDTFIAANSKQ
jgi:transcriptional regulator with XRE-family HTH domain